MFYFFSKCTRSSMVWGGEKVCLYGTSLYWSQRNLQPRCQKVVKKTAAEITVLAFFGSIKGMRQWWQTQKEDAILTSLKSMEVWDLPPFQPQALFPLKEKPTTLCSCFYQLLHTCPVEGEKDIISKHSGSLDLIFATLSNFSREVFWLLSLLLVLISHFRLQGCIDRITWADRQRWAKGKWASTEEHSRL